jgi:ubiquinone/menaquinone biosynthesis C-methylase UbiE
MKIQDNIVDEFNEFSKNYTNDMIGCVPYYLDLLSNITTGLPKQFNPKNILDLGCGNGNITTKLLPLFPKASYTLLDASQEMINLCKKQFQNNSIRYEVSYFKDFIFIEDHYDLIVAGFSLHHCEAKEKKELFQKIYKSLNKGGIFSYSDLMIHKGDSAHPKLLKKWKAYVHESFPDGEKWKWIMEHYDEFDFPDNLDDQIDWLKNNGFNKIRRTSYEKYWTHLSMLKE